ncbi:MAG: rhamnogalacturonan acetylesterase [Bacteroidales bacterium]|nr:MAG: rhamnogalacturonan acetylesterase [Bacteroidales bacterium]
MKHLIVFIAIFLFFFSCNPENNITIYMIGDSTMSDKPGPESNPERGWGQMLPGFFNEGVTVKNLALNGRSSKSFINEGHWSKVLDTLSPGDYVFIQFGHNDQKYKDSLRYTNPYTGYRRNLIKFVNETREKGGIPVLFSSIIRRNFNDYGVLIDTHGAYPLITREVADEYEVPFVDLQLKSEDLVLSTGQEKSKELFLWIEPGKNQMYPDGRQDNTHLSVKGASEIARLAIEGLRENELSITKYVKSGD